MPILAAVKRAERSRILRRRSWREKARKEEREEAGKIPQTEEIELEKETLYAIGAPAS